MLKRLCRILQPEGHVEILVQAKRGDDGGLWHFSIRDWYLVVAWYLVVDKIQVAEHLVPCQLATQVLHVEQWVPFRGGDVVKAPVVATGAPRAIRLLHNVERRGSGAV